MFNVLVSRYELNNVKVFLWQKFSLVPMVTHVVNNLMHRHQQKGEILQELNFKFSECIQTGMSWELKDITDPLKINKYLQTLFHPAINAKIIRHAHPTFQKLSPLL